MTRGGKRDGGDGGSLERDEHEHQAGALVEGRHGLAEHGALGLGRVGDALGVAGRANGSTQLLARTVGSSAEKIIYTVAPSHYANVVSTTELALSCWIASHTDGCLPRLRFHTS